MHHLVRLTTGSCKKWTSLAMAIMMFVTMLMPLPKLMTVAKAAQGAVANDLVFSQIYVAGGNSGAIYNTKFMEIYNPTDKDIVLDNTYSVQYAAKASNFAAGNNLVPLIGTIKAHGYYLLTGGSGTNGTALPLAADKTSSINPAQASGKLALVKKTAVISGKDDPAVIDFLGYGVQGDSSNQPNEYWGSVLQTDANSFKTGTILRKTNDGSNPKGVVGLGNGWSSKDGGADFVINTATDLQNPNGTIFIKNSSSAPEPEIITASPVSSFIQFTQSGGKDSIIGSAGAVTGGAVVKVYVVKSGEAQRVQEATAAADGSFTILFDDVQQAESFYLSATDGAKKESKLTRIDVSDIGNALTPISELRINDASGIPVNNRYSTSIEGIVTVENNLLGTGGSNFFIQDETGGIQVYGSKAPTVSFKAGDKVKISGHVDFVNGMTQFVPDSFAVTSTDTAVPQAKSITVDQLASYNTAEPLEGQLVSVVGKVTNIPATGPDYSITVQDASGNVMIVRVLGSTGIDIAQTLEFNQQYTFKGIVGQSKTSSPYTSGYFLMPRYTKDVKGELSFTHEKLTKAYKDTNVTFSAIAKNADSITVYYKGKDDSSYKSASMQTADDLNYNVTINKADIPANEFFYYMEAISSGKKETIGSADHPIAVNVVQDNDGPVFSDELPFNGDMIESTHPKIFVKMDDPSGVDEKSVKISIDGTDYTSKANATENSITLNLASVVELSEGKHIVAVEAKDKLGNLGKHTWGFTVLERFKEGNHYRGTTHNHTRISHDAAGEPEDALKEAQKYGYDWFAFSDHSHDIDANLVGQDTVERKNGLKERSGGADWELTKSLAKQYTKDGSFVVFPAFEMTSTTWGHSNVFGTDNFIDRKEENGIYQNLQKYYAWVLTYDNIVAQFNHPDMSKDAFDNFLPYDSKLDQLFTMVEVGNGSGKYGYTNAKKKFFDALDLGWHVAPTYGEDNHDATWGQTKKRTVIVSKALSQESLLESMRKMRVYFTEDPNFKLDVWASGYYMGSVVDTKDLEFDISGSDSVEESTTDPKYSYLKTPSDDRIDKVELITSGAVVVDTYTPPAGSKSFNWKPRFTVTGGQQWFVVRVTQKDGDTVYSAPIWTPAEALSVKVSNVDAVDGAITGGVPAPLKAGISNLGSISLKNLKVKFYNDHVDAEHLIGDTVIESLPANSSTSTSIVWTNPEAGNHKIVVVLEATDGNVLEANKFEQPIAIKNPLGITIMIDATHANENTTKDTGTYKDNMKAFTSMMRKEAYTVVENTAPITPAVLKDVNILMISHPATEYSESEINAIRGFVDRGGSALVLGKSNYKANQSPNSLLAGIGSTIHVNDDGVFDESKSGNFWSDPLKSNFSVRAHPKPVKNRMTDFVSALDYYSGASLAKANGTNKEQLEDSKQVTILVRGNETTFQDNVKNGGAEYSLYKAGAQPGDSVKGGHSIPLVASELLGSGRIVVSGMNIFNDKQMDQSFEPKGNVPFVQNVINWLAHRESTVTSIGDARKLPEGSTVVVEGTITSAADVFYDAFYVQDETGGVMAFNEVPSGSLKLGDKVRIYGQIKVFENNTEIEFGNFADSIVKISSGIPLEPQFMTTSEANVDENQGLLVKVTGKVTAIPDDNSYVINDGSGDILVFVDGYIINQSGPIPKLAVGETLEAVGLTGKFAEGTRIRVRDTRELKKGASTVQKGVELDQHEITLAAGGAGFKLNATVSPEDAPDKTVVWGTSDQSVATVDANGFVTPVGAGDAVITVKLADGGAAAMCVVYVLTSEIKVNGVMLNYPSLNMQIGGSAELTATVTPSDATNQAVKWSSSDDTVVTVQNGIVTAISAGQATITVTTVDGAKTAYCTVSVSDSDPGGPPADNGAAMLEKQLQLNKETAAAIAKATDRLAVKNLVSNVLGKLDELVESDKTTVPQKLDAMNDAVNTVFGALIDKMKQGVVSKDEVAESTSRLMAGAVKNVIKDIQADQTANMDKATSLAINVVDTIGSKLDKKAFGGLVESFSQYVSTLLAKVTTIEVRKGSEIANLNDQIKQASKFIDSILDKLGKNADQVDVDKTISLIVTDSDQKLRDSKQSKAVKNADISLTSDTVNQLVKNSFSIAVSQSEGAVMVVGGKVLSKVKNERLDIVIAQSDVAIPDNFIGSTDAYEFTLYANGNEYNQFGKDTVSISIPISAKSNTLYAYSYDEKKRAWNVLTDSKGEAMKAKQNGSTVTFETPQLSKFIVAEGATTKLTVKETSLSLLQSQSNQLTVTAIYGTSDKVDVTDGDKGTTYKSSNPDLVSVSENGLVQVSKDAKADSAVITITNGGKSVTVKVTVLTVKSIALSPDKTSEKAGKTVQFSVTATLSDHSKLDVTNGDTGTVYKLEDTSYATISKDGLLTVNKSAPAGIELRVTVETNGFTKVAFVNVKKP
ncbi:hypothetical protein BRE01_36300 [Brevibacillus reuszeri]|uniref:Uncharacterized protein n=1 Tax=Brevibacillus reuszeri TaxID=54915 RepID=A0ABQ0TPQ0_9BACL|nr:DUF4350 domain-containing protein [Brevibacillus reuszeri]MED1861387.1 Ig-like domain-containing protein [Brevibacillus reuszeri]GED69928.1 hypothetical protein BRE01_36300 [Brevibacillus reuszeri]